MNPFSALRRRGSAIVPPSRPISASCPLLTLPCPKPPVKQSGVPSLIGVLRLVWPVLRDTIGRIVAQDHGAVDVTLPDTGRRDADTVKLENMTPEPRAFRLAARHPSPELPTQGIGGEVGIRCQLPLCLAVEAGGGRAAITGGDPARFEVPTGRNLVEAG